MNPTTRKHAVEVIQAQEVRVGDRIWAPDDGDWFWVQRIEDDWSFTFFRADGTEAAFFKHESKVLRLVEGSNGES